MAHTVQCRFYFTTRLCKGIFHKEISLQDTAIQRINSKGGGGKYSVKAKKPPTHVTDETV